jgi:hypothetical protein
MRPGAVAPVLAAALGLLAGAAFAQTRPTLTDLATCNEEALARAGQPSALPGPRPGRPAEPPAGTARGPALDPPASGGVGEKTDPTGSIITQSPDPLLEGMDAERAADPAYRAAYRQCMKGRAGGGR